MAEKRKRLPLPRRFSASLTEEAYAALRDLNARWGLGNNYLLVVLLENLGEIAEPERLEAAFERFVAEYGAPSGGMKPTR